LNYIYILNSYRAVNTLRLSSKDQSANVEYGKIAVLSVIFKNHVNTFCWLNSKYITLNLVVNRVTIGY